jgi:AAA domain
MSTELVPLAAAIECGNGPLPPYTGKLIQAAPESFDDGRAAQIAFTVRAMRATGQPVSMKAIGEMHVDLLTFIGTELSNADLPAEEAEYHAEKCWEAYQVRRAKSIGAEMVQSLESSPKLASSIIAAARVALDNVTNETANGLPELIDAAAFIGETIQPPAELIGGILHKGSKLAFGGSSKSFKTWCLLDLAISVATGTDWLGRVTAQGKVLFLNFEIQPHAWQRRIAAVARAKGVELKSGQIILWNLRGHGADFRQIIPLIIQRCRTENFALIVLDPIYKLYGGTDENAAGDVAELLNSLECLATETGAAIAFGAHFAKGNASAKEAIDRISGSGVFARDPDSLLIFTKHETDDAFSVEPILRNFAPVEPFAVRWQFPLMQLADDLDPSKLKQVAGRKKEYNPKKLLAAIADSTPEKPVSVSAWAHAGNVPRNTLSGYLPEMRLKNWIGTIGEGNNARQYITNDGKALINEN